MVTAVGSSWHSGIEAAQRRGDGDIETADDDSCAAEVDIVSCLSCAQRRTSQ